MAASSSNAAVPDKWFALIERGIVAIGSDGVGVEVVGVRIPPGMHPDQARQLLGLPIHEPVHLQDNSFGQARRTHRYLRASRLSRSSSRRERDVLRRSPV